MYTHMYLSLLLPCGRPLLGRPSPQVPGGHPNNNDNNNDNNNGNGNNNDNNGNNQ